MYEPGVSFGAQLRARRRVLDLTQAELGRLAGCSAAAIRKIEAEERRPSAQLAGLLADALGVKGVELEQFVAAARGRPVQFASAMPPEPAPRTPHNLPAPLTSFVNRTQDVDAVVRLLRGPARLVTLIGPAGIGKTRLAIHSAEVLLPEFGDGIWFVDLAGVNDPALALPAVAHAVGLRDLADRPLPERLTTLWREKRVLLVLDNFEQVLDAAPDIANLLRGSRGLKALVTSRVALGVYGEHEYAPPPLSLPPPGAGSERMLDFEAVQLFVERVRQHQPDFGLSGGSAEDRRRLVSSIVRKLEGIPLALEIAAASLRRLPLAELAATVTGERRWLDALVATARDLPPRQRTLAAAIAWSADLLEPAAAARLCQLAVFAGPFSTEAAGAVWGESDADAQSELAALVDQSLLAPEAKSWRMLEMVREYGWGRMTAAERSAARQRHAEHYQRRLADETPDVAEIGREYGNYAAALRYRLETRDGKAALAMCAGLGWFWETQGYAAEGLSLIRASLALASGRPADELVRVLFKAANLSWQAHDFAAARQFAEQAIHLAETADLPGELPGLYNLLGRVGIEAGDLDQAEADLRQAVDLVADRPGAEAGFPILQLGEVALARGDRDRAAALFGQAEATLPPGEPDLAVAILHTNLGELNVMAGDMAAARAELQTALPHARVHVRRMRFLLVTLAGLLLAEIPPDAAAAFRCLSAERSLSESSAPLSPMYLGFIAARNRLAASLLTEVERGDISRAAETWDMADILQFAQTALHG
jgi:predicted ATPase/transcriptional regulator with XRE-family HTH domain